MPIRRCAISSSSSEQGLEPDTDRASRLGDLAAGLFASFAPSRRSGGIRVLAGASAIAAGRETPVREEIPGGVIAVREELTDLE
jgi:hypothetical protein